MKTIMRGNREGMALMLVIIVVMVGATVAAGAAVIGANSWLMTQYEERQSLMQAAADAGVEEGRARLNGNPTLYPATGFNTLENNVQVTDAAGAPILNIRRTSYAGPIGVTTGQYGVFGSVVSVAQDANGDKVIRRAEIVQESFAKFAYFTNIEGTVNFGSGDVLQGPVHSNDQIEINPGGATFLGPVTTASNILGTAYGTFPVGYLINQPIIPMPTVTALNGVLVHATAGGMNFTSTTLGTAGQATMRLFFVAVDLNGDGDRTDSDEGFVRVYSHTTNPSWVSASRPGADWRTSRNCGHTSLLYHPLPVGNFVDANTHTTAGLDSWNLMLEGGTARCYLGGDERLWDGAFMGGVPAAADAMGGRWLRWTGVPDPRIAAVGRVDGPWLFPLHRAGNPSFRGVIHVTGKVVISGELRGRITLAATNNIIIGDDMRYSVNAGAGVCTDILGLFSGTDVVIADNGINAPNQADGGTGAGTYYTWDDTSDEFLDAVVLALSEFTVENYSTGATATEFCGAASKGRGCLFLTGGIIQNNRGPVGMADGHGNTKRYSYDACAGTDPPPYFPTTGRFAKTRTFDVDPTGFNITTYFATITAR